MALFTMGVKVKPIRMLFFQLKQKLKPFKNLLEKIGSGINPAKEIPYQKHNTVDITFILCSNLSQYI